MGEMREGTMTHKLRAGLLALSAATMFGAAAAAQEPLRIGLILPMTGPFASTGRQIDAAVKLYIEQNGATVAGRKIEVLLRDDTGVAPDTTRRLAQELVVNNKVDILAGFGLTPLAFAAAPVATQAKTPMIVMAAATSAIMSKSPYIVRTSFTATQAAYGMGDWGAKNGIKKVFTIVSDFAPGIDTETWFKNGFTAGGGTVVGEVRVPLRNPDYAPFVQRAKDAQPDAVFAFVPSGEGAALMKQFAERGLTQAGIKLIGTGDVTDDDLLDNMGPPAMGMITAHFYSAAHPSEKNKAYVAAFEKANNGMRPNFMSLGGYDGMHLIYEVLKKTSGSADGEKFVAAAKGMSWESPRGPVKIEPETRDITHNVYIRKVEQANGKLYNVEFATMPMMQDPAAGK
jgi:branched-chain amino acid transport system substrate-binding protein